MSTLILLVFALGAAMVIGILIYNFTRPEIETKVNWTYNYDQALYRAKAENKPVLMDFYTDWCGWCKKLDEETYSDEAVVVLLNERFICLRVDAEKHADLAEEYNVLVYPTIVFLSPDGKETGRIVGYEPPYKFLQDAKNILFRV